MEPKTSIMKSIFLFSSKNKAAIVNCFRVLYAFVIIGLITAFFLRLNGLYPSQLAEIAELSGQTTVILFCIVLIPGILKRFSITWNIRTIIMLFRRQLGVLTFLVAFLHFSLMRLFPYFMGYYILRFPLATFELFGVISLFLMSFLFFTSNSYSVKKLGKWWNWIHMLIYVIAWTIAFHVTLVEIGIFSYIIIVFAVFETVSLIYFYLLRKKPTILPPVNPKV